MGSQSAIGVAQSDHEALKRDTSMRRKRSFYLNRTTTLSASRPRVPTLVLPPLGGQSAIGVAQSDHEALKRDTSMRRKWSFYLNRTPTLGANGPAISPRSSPPWEAKLREGSLKVTKTLLRETHPRPRMVVLLQQNDHFERESAPRYYPGLPPLGRPKCDRGGSK